MNAPDTPNSTGPVEIDTSLAEDTAGGGMCSGDDLVNLTASLKEAYENLVDFTSHVIERVSNS
jgi:hypothetical protein